MKPLASSWLRDRTAGVLAPLSALPGEFGIGNLGRGARTMIDFLAETGFRHWQICPVGPTGFGDSPYQSFSSFAGNPYFIDLSELESVGLLTSSELAPLREMPHNHVEYGDLYLRFWTALGQAHVRFVEMGDEAPWGGLAALHDFEAEHADWLDSYAAFMALKHRFGGHPWRLWPEQWRDWKPGIEKTLPNSAAAEARRQRFYQFLFFRQWAGLRDYAHERSISIIGDVPIFVALDSADTWRWREVFRINADGVPEAIAGVPPDYFSDRGQCWGNPLYNWDHLRETGYEWWIKRLGAVFQLCDVVRLDHFRGFNDFWEIPMDAVDARRGEWIAGPGMEFFEAIQNALPEAKLIAEDLGYINAGVVDLRRSAGLPGMKILQFGYWHDDNNVNLPHFFDRDTVVYTGTHDNETARGWLESLDEEQRATVQAYFGIPAGEDSSWPLVRAAYASVSKLAVIPVQDLFDLPTEARMNRPGTVEGNWQWRFTEAMLLDLLEAKGDTLRHWHELFDRTGDGKQRDFSAPPGELSSPSKAASPQELPTPVS